MSDDQSHTVDEMYELNPNWQFAQDHRQASRVGIPMNDPGSNKKHVDIVLCKCCLKQIHKQPIPLCQNVKEIYFLGFGFPLYFSLIKCCALLLFIHLISYGAYEMYTDLTTNSNQCSNIIMGKSLNHLRLSHSVCPTFMIQQSSMSSHLTGIQVLMRVLAFVAHMIALIYVKQIQHSMHEYMDEKILTLSSYAVILQGLPSIPKIQTRIKKLFNNGFKEKFGIQKIILIQSLFEIEELNQQVKQLIKEKKKYLGKKEAEEEEVQQKMMQVDEQIQTIKVMRKKLIEAQQTKFINDQLQSQKAIILVKSEEQRNKLIQCFKELTKEQKIQHFGGEGQKAIMYKAPQPREIIWENINYSKKKAFIRMIISWTIYTLFICGLFSFFYIILTVKASYLENAFALYEEDPNNYKVEHKKAVAVVYIVSVIIILFNKFIMTYVLHKMSEWQKHSTLADLQLSFAVKYAICKFLTTALMALAVQAISFNNYFTHDYGLIQQETIMFILNGFLVPLIWLINPSYLFMLLKRYIYQGSSNMTQQQANKLMELPSYDMGKRIAQVVKTMWFTFLFATLIPVGCIINMVSLLAYYWIDKYNLFYRSSLLMNIPANLPTNALFMLDFTLILMPAGTLLFDFHIRNTVHPSTLVMIVTAIVFFLIPKDKILKVFIDEKFELRRAQLHQVQHLFIESYQTLHPIIKSIKIQQHLLSRKNSLKATTSVKEYPSESKTFKDLEMQIQNLRF